MLQRSSALMLLLVLLAACDGGDSPPPSDAGTARFDGGGDELDCTDVFDCVEDCRDGDDACIEDCIARGSEPALVVIDDVLECAESNGCTDEVCLETRCEAELLACAGLAAVDSGVRDDGGAPDAGGSHDASGVRDAAGTGDAGGAPDAGAGCEGAGKPEVTGPISGLAASYAQGARIDIGVPVDEDTVRVSVGIYEVGSMLYLGGSAEDVASSSTAMLSLYAGVVGGKTGEFYLSVTLCSTSICNTPTVRNTYQRADRSAPFATGESYVETREHVGGPGPSETCPSSIPIQSFLIE